MPVRRAAFAASPAHVRHRRHTSLRTAAATLLAAAALLLAPAVVSGPAAADDGTDAGTKIAVGIQPLGIAEGPDGALYISDYQWAGGISVYPAGETAPSRTINAGRFPSSLAMTPDGTGASS